MNAYPPISRLEARVFAFARAIGADITTDGNSLRDGTPWICIGGIYIIGDDSPYIPIGFQLYINAIDVYITNLQLCKYNDYRHGAIFEGNDKIIKAPNCFAGDSYLNDLKMTRGNSCMNLLGSYIAGRLVRQIKLK